MTDPGTKALAISVVIKMGAFLPGMVRDQFGNASSVHHFGQQAKAALEVAKRQFIGLQVDPGG